MSYYPPAEDPFEDKPVKKKVQRKRPKRCVNCRENLESDGYGGFVHSGTEEWPATYYGCSYEDDNGFPITLRPTDPRWSHVATPAR